MDEIFKQYGSAIITVLAIVAVIGIIVLVIGTDKTSIVYISFNKMIEGFYAKANTAAGFTTP